MFLLSALLITLIIFSVLSIIVYIFLKRAIRTVCFWFEYLIIKIKLRNTSTIERLEVLKNRSYLLFSSTNRYYRQQKVQQLQSAIRRRYEIITLPKSVEEQEKEELEVALEELKLSLKKHTHEVATKTMNDFLPDERILYKHKINQSPN